MMNLSFHLTSFRHKYQVLGLQTTKCKKTTTKIYTYLNIKADRCILCYCVPENVYSITHVWRVIWAHFFGRNYPRNLKIFNSLYQICQFEINDKSDNKVISTASQHVQTSKNKIVLILFNYREYCMQLTIRCTCIFFRPVLKETECTTNPKRLFSEVQYLFRRLKNLQLFAFSQTNQLKKVLVDLKG